MQLLFGECLGVTQQTREHNGSSWIETKIHVLDGVRTTETTITKDFAGSLPTRGDFIVLEVGVRAYAGKNGAGYSVTAFGRPADLERALRPVHEARLKAAEPKPVQAVNS